MIGLLRTRVRGSTVYRLARPIVRTLRRWIRGSRVARLAQPLVARWRLSRAYTLFLRRTERRAVEYWERIGRPVPPLPAVKRALIASYGRRFGTRMFVETGTYTGETVASMLWRFERLVSIELHPCFAQRARERFAPFRHVTILEGDSSLLVRKLLKTLDEPALFWLDAHYSGAGTAHGEKQTPVMEELGAIFETRLPHVVLIDDAREFTGDGEFPSLDEVRSFASYRRPDLHFDISDDIIRITP